MTDPLTPRVALEIVGHEAIVQEAYKDSEDVWTWGIGVTDRSGHKVMRYKDNPQPIRRCLEIYIWLLRALFFDGKWSSDGKALVLPVNKPSYQPSFRRGKKVDIRADVEALLAT